MLYILNLISQLILPWVICLAISFPHIYYNTKLGSGCNLDKDLYKRRMNDYLVKHKNIGLYL